MIPFGERREGERFKEESRNLKDNEKMT